jgi:hypothetical protein
MDERTVRERVDALPDAFFQGGEIPARQVGPADGTGKEAIPNDGTSWPGTRRGGRQDKHDLARGMAGYVTHLDLAAGKGQGQSIDQIRLAIGHGPGCKPVGRLDGGHLLDERQVVLVTAQGKITGFLDGRRSADMVKVSMGGKKGFQLFN